MFESLLRSRMELHENQPMIEKTMYALREFWQSLGGTPGKIWRCLGWKHPSRDAIFFGKFEKCLEETPEIHTSHDVFWAFRKTLFASCDMMISSQICGSKLVRVFHVRWQMVAVLERDPNPGNDIRVPPAMTVQRVCTVLLRNCWSDFGCPLTKKGHGRKQIAPLMGAWNCLPSFSVPSNLRNLAFEMSESLIQQACLCYRSTTCFGGAYNDA